MNIQEPIKEHSLRWLPLVIPLIVISVIAGVWRYTPLQDYASPESLRDLIAELKLHWWLPLLILPFYIFAHFILFPNMVINAAIIITFGGFWGWLYAITGSLTSASVFFSLGHRFGARRLKKLLGKRIIKLRTLLRKGGIGAVVSVRLVPIAPYPIINLAAGAIHIKYRDFLFGSFIGHLPGTITLAVFGEQLETVLGDPSPQNIAILVTIVLIGVLFFWLVKNYVRKCFDKDLGT